MPELIAKPALDAGPLTLAGCTLSLADPGPITSVAVFPGGDKAVAKALKPLGLTFPAPNSLVARDDALLVWTGREQAFLIGVEAPDFGGAAAVTDQSGGWATLELAGALAADALMRHVPLDLRPATFAVGRAVRVPLNHMSAVLMRPAPDRFRIMVFRSMARTAWNELDHALRGLAARQG